MAYNPNFQQQNYGAGYPPTAGGQQLPYFQNSGYPVPGQQFPQPPFHPPPPGIYPGGTNFGPAVAYPQQPVQYPQGQFGQQFPQGPPPPSAFHFPHPEHHQPKPDDVNYAMGGETGGISSGGFEFNDKTIRRAFIRKVYSILMIQLGITIGFIALFLFHAPLKLWTRANPGFFFGALVLTFVLLIAMVCCEGVRRKSPGNIICLMLFTLCEGFVLGAAASTYRADAVLLALGVTTVVCLALTIFSFQTKWDFTAYGGILFVAVIILLVFSIMVLFLRSKYPILHLVYACLGALIFSIYLVYDTQMMMGGKHKYSISPEEYIFAALNLYLDIVQIFMYILAIIGYTNDN